MEVVSVGEGVRGDEGEEVVLGAGMLLSLLLSVT